MSDIEVPQFHLATIDTPRQPREDDPPLTARKLPMPPAGPPPAVQRSVRAFQIQKLFAPTFRVSESQNLECTSNEILVEFWMIYYTKPSYFVDTVESGYVKEIRPPAFET